MERPLCRVCGKNPVKSKGRNANGARVWATRCSPCCKKRNGVAPQPIMAERPRPTCLVCERNPVQMQGRYSSGARIWGRHCSACHRRMRKGLAGPAKQRPPQSGWPNYRRAKKDSCERCGFVALHPAQLDVDHADGNGLNHDPSNLVTLCANCHRLKTAIHNDHLTPRVLVVRSNGANFH